MTHSEFPLPQEILELIVSYLSHDIDSLRRILQVGRALAPVIRKYLYREITLLDDKNDPKQDKPQPRPIFIEASFLALLKGLPFLAYLVRVVRICGSTRCTKETYYTTSKHLHLILPHLPSLESISFQRTRPGPWDSKQENWRFEPYMLVTAQIAKAIPPSVRSVWLDQVRFESEAAVDMFFNTCRHLTHLGLNKVSYLPEQYSLRGRIASAVKCTWSRVFPTLPSIPLNVEPIELRSYAHGRLVSLPRLPFIDSEKAPYFKVSSVTNLKLYSPGRHCCAMLPTCWDTVVCQTASSVQDLMIVAGLCKAMDRPNTVWNLAGRKHLRSLFLVLLDITTLPENLLTHSLESLTILVCKNYMAWAELDAQLNELPFISRVEIFYLSEPYPPLAGFVDFCSSTWNSWETDEWKEGVIRGMPLLSERGILIVKQFRTVL